MGAGIAVVTGGGTGVGAAIAVALARAGWQTVIAGRREEPLHELAATHPELSLLPVPTDVTSPESVRLLFEEIDDRFGRLDLLVNNAGCSGSATAIDEIDLDEWRSVIDLNMTGTLLCTRAAFGLMRMQEPQGGRILNNGSISAHSPRAHSIAYTATKHAITGMTKSTSLDGRACNIACGQFDIGNAATEMTESTEQGALQADGQMRSEPTFDAAEVGTGVVYMAGLPLSTNVLNMTVMATAMPFVGRG